MNSSLFDGQPDLFIDTHPAPAVKRASTKRPLPASKPREMIDPNALDVLVGIECSEAGDQFLAKLTCDQLDRGLYEHVDDILQRIGGKWSSRLKGHRFDFDPTSLVQEVARTGEMPENNPLDYFPTPAAVVNELLFGHTGEVLDWIARNTDYRVLEPSGGTGGIARELLKRYPALAGRIDMVEVDPLKCAVLRSLGAGEVYQCRFEDWQPEPGRDYRAVLMNPPFTVPGNKTAYADHIRKAYDLISGKFGAFAAICPPGFLWRGDQKLTAFRNFVAENLDSWSLRKGAFKESGTTVETLILSGDPSLFDHSNRAYEGYRSWHTWNWDLLLDNDPDSQEAKFEFVRRFRAARVEDPVLVEEFRSFLWKFAERESKESQGSNLLSLSERVVQDLIRDLLLTNAEEIEKAAA